MAVAFWLPKVVIVLSFCGTPLALYDDLLDRVRISKSNDPEVRDFLKTVLRHHDDFRWIQGEVGKTNRDEQILPLQGLASKNKRSFYSSKDGYPSYVPYGYRMSESGYDRPINDAYPYDEEERRYPHNVGERTYRAIHDHEPPAYGDFLEEGEEPESDIASFVSDEGPRIARRSLDDADLLNERLKLRNMVYKNRHDDDSAKGTHLQNEDSINIQPYSEKGVLYAPGNKYEFKTDDYKKRCIVDNSEQEVKYDEIEKKSNISIAPAVGEFYYSIPHDVLGMNQDIQMEQHQNITFCNKFKKSPRKTRSLHFDVLHSKKSPEMNRNIKIKIFDDNRLVKDIKKGDYSNSIVLTIKNDNKAPIEQTKSVIKPTPLEPNVYPGLSSLMYNDDTLQKIDSIIKHDEATLKLSAQLPLPLKQKKDSRLLDYDLMQLNDEPAKNATTVQRKSIDYLHADKNEPDFATEKSLPETESTFAVHKVQKKPISYQRMDEVTSKTLNMEMETSPKEEENDVDGSYEYRPLPNSYFLMSKNGKKAKTMANIRRMTQKSKDTDEPYDEDDSITTIPADPDKLNRLEDQTEPTSAAEQRELGKVNNKFTPMMNAITTEKMLIIPFKKNSNTDNQEEEDDRELYEKEFHVKESKDMIHKEKIKKSKNSENLTDKSLHNAEEVMGQLKQDLENNLKRKYAKDDRIPLTDDDSLEDLIDKDDTVVSNDNYNEDYTDEWGGNLRLNTLTDEANNAAKESNFQSRNLQWVHRRVKRNLLEFLGMTNDEDYSEDKLDDYDADANRKLSDDNNEDEFGTVTKFKPASPKPLMEKARKSTKTDPIYKRYQNRGKARKSEKHHLPRGSEIEKRNLFTNNLDKLQKRDSSMTEVSKYKVLPSPKDNDDEAEGALEEAEKPQPAPGNELAIIERTQAILLHVTNPPAPSCTSLPPATSLKGEDDDNDDPSSKINSARSNTPHVVRSSRMDDDVVEQIIKLVNRFKQNEKVKQIHPSREDGARYHHYLIPIDEDVEDDASFAHHVPKNKKAHSSNPKEQNWGVKAGTDHMYNHPKHMDRDSAFNTPHAAKEVPTSVETVSVLNDDDENDFDNPLQYTPDNVDSFEHKHRADDDPDDLELDSSIAPLQESLQKHRKSEKKFHVKESKDMIHNKQKTKKSKNSESLTDKSLHNAQEVMGQLKQDLENNLKRKYAKDDRIPLTDDDSLEDLIDKDDTVVSNDNYNEDYIDEWGGNLGLNTLTAEANSAPEESNFQSRNLQSVHRRAKRNLPGFLGMTNDEDYSEDKIDDYDADAKRKLSDDSNEDEFGTVTKFKPASPKPLMEKARKSKKTDPIYKRYQNRGKARKSEKHHLPRGSEIEKRNLFTNNLDKLQKRDSSMTEVSKYKVLPSPKDNDDEAEGALEEAEKPQPAPGNELDIIERTQAILLHVTNPPVLSCTSLAPATSLKGEYDENDDPNSKANAARSNTPHAVHSSKMDDKNDDDVVEQIMKLVNRFKQNEKVKKVHRRKEDAARYHHYLIPIDEDVEEDASFAHHAHKDKKAHPSSLKDKNCDIKTGTDHTYIGYHPKHMDRDSEFNAPHAAKEGSISVETISVPNDEENSNKRALRYDFDNPLQYTPDNLDSFKHIVESDDTPSEFVRTKRGAEYVLETRKGNRDKRRADDDPDDLELDSLIAPLQESLKHKNNYYYNPLQYQSYPKYRQAPDAGGSTSGECTTKSSEYTSNDKCMAEEDVKIMENKCMDEPHKSKPHAKSKGKSKPSQDNGDMTYDSRMEHMSDKDREKDQFLRDKNRERLKNDKIDNGRQEHERMKNVLNGHLVLDIMEKFSLRLKENQNLNSRFGSGISRKCAADQVNYIQMFREEQSKKDIKHAQLMLHQIIMMINKIVADQVHRRTCLGLPPTVRDFLKRAVSIRPTSKSMKVAEGYPLPPIKNKDSMSNQVKPDEDQGDFLFEKTIPDTSKLRAEVIMKKKIALIKKLLRKYDSMSENCQVAVEPVKDYLTDHLAMLEKLYKEKKVDTDDTCGDVREKCSSTQPPSQKPTAAVTGASVTGATQKSAESQTTTAATVAQSATQTPTTPAPQASSAQPPAQPPAQAPPLPPPAHARSVNKYNNYNNDYNNYNYLNSYKNSKGLSDKYKKLVEAADNFRRKRQIEQRLARLFGRHKEDDDEVKPKDKKLDDISKIAFESPVVYSLDE